MKTLQDFDYMGLKIPAGTLLPVDPKECPLLKKPGNLEKLPLSHAMTWCMTGKILPYPGNRGGSNTINDNTYKSALNDGPKADAIGEFSFGMYGNGDYYTTLKDGVVVPDETQRLHQTCFHSRMKGFVTRYLAGRMTANELRTEMTVRYVRDFLSTYWSHGIAQQGHNNKMKTNTLDFAYGVHLQRLRNKLGTAICEALQGKKFSTIYTVALYSMHLENQPDQEVSWLFHKVYHRRTKASALADHPKGTLNISEDQMDRFELAIRFWYDIMLFLKKMCGMSDISNFTSSSGFFGYFVSEYYGGAGIPHNPEIIAKRMLANQAKLNKVASSLCRTGIDEMRETVMDVTEILRKKVVGKQIG